MTDDPVAAAPATSRPTPVHSHHIADEDRPRFDVLRRLLLRRIFFAQLALVGALIVLTGVAAAFPERIGSFYFCLLLGCLGASVSLMKRSRRASLRSLEDHTIDWVSTLMPLLYGGLMAGIAYLLFLSGMLSGDGGNGLFTTNLFPNFTKPEAPPGSVLSIREFLAMRPSTLESLGKLLVWCFVAGYSESFVTGVLRQLERREDKKPAESS